MIRRSLVAVLVAAGATAADEAPARDLPNPSGRVTIDPLVLRTPVHGAAGSFHRSVPVDLAEGAVLLDETYYDLQDFGSLGKRIVVGSDGVVHVTFMNDFCEITSGGCPPDLLAPQPFPERSNAYMFRDGLGQWSSTVKASDPSLRGCCVTELFGGYGAMTVTNDGRAVVAPHLNEDGCDSRAAMYVQDAAGGSTFKGYLTPISDPSYLFPQVGARPDGSFVILGEVAEFGTYNETQYFDVAYLGAEGDSFSCPVGWQFGDWQSVIQDFSGFRDGAPAYPAMAVAADGTVGVAVGDFGGNVVLYESADGLFAPGSTTVTQITSYSDAAVVTPDASSDQYRSYIHCDLAYNGNEPNVAWSELQARRDGTVFFVDYRSRIMHWNPTDGASVVYRTAGEADSYAAIDTGGSGPLAGFNTISVDWPQVGFSGDGSGVYVTWSRFVDGEVDSSADAGLPGIVTGIGYGDIAWARQSGPGTWSTPENATNTPNADERFASLAAHNPDGRLHLVFQASATDEAGVATIGDRGIGTTNIVRRVAYLEVQVEQGTAAAPAPLATSALTVFPNPGSGAFRFALPGLDPDAAPQELLIYAVNGRLVARERFSGPVLQWNGRGADGEFVANGVYFARLRDSTVQPTKFTIVR